MSLESDFLLAVEEHSPDAIRSVLARGLDANLTINGKPPTDCLVESYLRSDRFTECLRALLESGAALSDPLLRTVLLDDDAGLQRHLAAHGEDARRTLSLPCAFTNCRDVTALHVCAEFNRIRCARALLAAGADVNARAGRDPHGIGGQTPVFHAVNSIFNHCRPTLEVLVEAGADLEVRLQGLLWGHEQEWETLLLDVTPLSYAQCGLYAQFHRREQDVQETLTYLYRRLHGVNPPVRNVPNRYLARSRGQGTPSQ